MSALGRISQGGKDKGRDREAGIPRVTGRKRDEAAGNVGNSGCRLERDKDVKEGRDKDVKEGGRGSFEAHLEGHVAQESESGSVRCLCLCVFAFAFVHVVDCRVLR